MFSLTLMQIAMVAIIAFGLFLVLGIRIIPNTRIGVVERRWSSHGSLRSGLIALNGEAGFQPDVLRGGVHWRMPFQYRVHILPLVTIPQGKIGYIFARDGQPLPPTQSLASNQTARFFENVRDFLSNSGQRGPQRKILREGTYAINLAQFVVITEDRMFYLPLDRSEQPIFVEMAAIIEERHGFEPLIIKGADDQVGIVTVHDGPALPDGQIIAPVVGNVPDDATTYHNNFQDPEQFLASGGRRGRQLQVLVEGTYYINRLFATIEMIHKTVVEVGYVGVVVSYTGETGADLSGTDYKHGELVRRGQRGVWSEALLPGKYAFNTYAGRAILVPTTNFILKWIKNETGSHRFDANLSEVSLITKDAFEPSLPLSVVVHIDYRKAPLVIQRFGDIQKLVEQTLDPMVSAYFKNVAQTRTLIQLLQDRSAIQAIALNEMQEKFEHYNLELEEVLIGTPTSSKGDQRIEEILTQLRARQIAMEQIETYARQEQAAVKERDLREAEARARQQQQLTESELNITVETNQGKAEFQRSLQEANRIRAMADAEGSKVRILAHADAERAARLGVAQAIAIEEQVRAYGGPQFQLTQQVMNRFAEAIQESGIEMVPRIVVGASMNGNGGGNGSGNGNGGGGGGGGGYGSLGAGNVVEAMLAMLLSERFGTATSIHATRGVEAQTIHDEILKDVAKADAANKSEHD